MFTRFYKVITLAAWAICFFGSLYICIRYPNSPLRSLFEDEVFKGPTLALVFCYGVGGAMVVLKTTFPDTYQSLIRPRTVLRWPNPARNALDNHPPRAVKPSSIKTVGAAFNVVVSGFGTGVGLLGGIFIIAVSLVSLPFVVGNAVGNLAAWLTLVLEVVGVIALLVHLGVGIGHMRLFILPFRPIVQLDTSQAFEDPPGLAKPFGPYYRQVVVPLVQEAELKRVATLRVGKKRLVAGAIAMIPVTGIIIYWSLAASVWFWVLFALYAWSQWPLWRYRSHFKESVFPKVFAFFGDDVAYHPRGDRLTIRSLTPSPIIPDYDREKTEDGVQGTHAGVRFDFQEATLTKGFTRDVFKGVVLRFELARRFKANTIVFADQSIAVADPLRIQLSQFRRLKPVRLEDPIFARQFEVYSSNQVAARVVVTPAFMERLLELGQRFRGTGLRCSFYDNTLLLMIPSTRDRLEPTSATIYHPTTLVNECKEILQQMEEIFQIIDTLKLHEQTGL